MIEHFAIVAAIILSVVCPNAVQEPQFKITTKRDNDKVEVNVENNKAVISVRSPF